MCREAATAITCTASVKCIHSKTNHLLKAILQFCVSENTVPISLLQYIKYKLILSSTEIFLSRSLLFNNRMLIVQKDYTSYP